MFRSSRVTGDSKSDLNSKRRYGISTTYTTRRIAEFTRVNSERAAGSEKGALTRTHESDGKHVGEEATAGDVLSGGWGERPPARLTAEYLDLLDKVEKVRMKLSV